MLEIFVRKYAENAHLSRIFFLQTSLIAVYFQPETKKHDHPHTTINDKSSNLLDY